MNYRRVGNSGLKVSEICLGAWINFGDRIDDAVTFAVLDAAVENGINFFDTADVYAGGKAEEVMGRWMKDKDRRQQVVATKCRWGIWPGPNGSGASRKHIMDACNDSLRRLQTDYIDIYQIHGRDHETPLEEMLRALDDLVHSGKILYYGLSNHDAAAIAECALICEKYGLYRPISLQNYYNMLGPGVEQHETPACLKYGLSHIPYSPLAQGLLSDKYTSGKIPAGSRAEGNEHLKKDLEAKLPKLQALGAVSKDKGVTLSQLALAWLLHRPAMAAPIIGASSPEQVAENAKAADVKLSEEEMARIEEILKA
jgi:aryl-alcohol dehydrogenase-like predicted oxidoreductase